MTNREHGELVEDLRGKIALVLDKNYHTAISKALSTADEVLALPELESLSLRMRELEEALRKIVAEAENGDSIHCAFLADTIGRAALTQ